MTKPLDELTYDELLTRAAGVLDQFGVAEPVPDEELRPRAKRFLGGWPELDPAPVQPPPEVVDRDELVARAAAYLGGVPELRALPGDAPPEPVPVPEPEVVNDFDELMARAAPYLGVPALPGDELAEPEPVEPEIDREELRANAERFLRGLPELRVQGRDHLGRFASGSGGGASAAPVAGQTGGAGEDAGGGGTVTAEQAHMALMTSLDITPAHPIRIAPDQVDKLMGHLAGGTAVNLENVQVTGAGNGNLFARHATETPRSQMPQLPETEEKLAPFRQALADRGVTVRVGQVDPRALHATQAELDGAKVGSIYGFVRSGGYNQDSVIIASREGAVLDGHHRWAGASAAVAAGSDFKIKVMTVDMGIEDLLAFSDPFSGARKPMGQAGELAAV